MAVITILPMIPDFGDKDPYSGIRNAVSNCKGFGVSGMLRGLQADCLGGSGGCSLRFVT